MGQTPFEPSTLGARIAHARRLLGVREGRDMPVTELAARVEMSAASVYGWEADGKAPRDDVLQRLAVVLGVTPAWLRYGVGEGPELRAAVQPEAEGARRITDAEIARARAVRDKEERARVAKRGKGA